MNKEELKQKLRNNSWGVGYKDRYVILDTANKLIDQLDEPNITSQTQAIEFLAGEYNLTEDEVDKVLLNYRKPAIPKFVADWIEKCKDFNLDLFESMTSSQMSKEVSDWLEDLDGDGLDLYARAWLDGYTVEEKKYRVKLGKAYIGEFSGIGNIVFDKKDAFVYTAKEYAEGTAELTGGTVEEVER